MNYILAENAQGIYVIPKSHLEYYKTARMLKNGTEHEPEVVKTIIEYSGDGIVIHAGAYIGDMIPAISKGVERLIAFEPNKEAYNCAMACIYLNKCENVTIYNLALGEESSLGILDKDQFRTIEKGINVELKNDEKFIHSEPIDFFVGNVKCTVIHLDVELHEIPVLKGAINTIKRDNPLLIIEDLNNTLNENKWFKENILSIYREINKIGPNRVYKCEK